MKKTKLNSASGIVKCPLCLSERTDFLFSVNGNTVAKHLNAEKNDVLISITEKIWNGSSCSFYKCKECTFSFAWPFKAANMEFYSALYDDVIFYPKQKWDYSVTYNSIYQLYEKNNFKDVHLLEIGAGNGSFIKSISPKLIPKKNILCTEFSNYGINEILKYGVNCISADLKNIKESNIQNKFDIICMFQVLEHIDAYDDFFNKLNDLSAKDGHLYLTVPNYRYREFYDSKGSNFDIPPIHVSRWNKKTLEKLCNKYQWRLIEYKTESPGFLKKLRRFSFNRYYRLDLSIKIDKIQNKGFQLSIKSVIFIFIIICYFPSVVRLGITKMGVAQWAHFQKQ